jgi:hypothetical protein
VPKYFLKQTILDTWNHTIEGYLHLGTFTQDPKDSVLYIPNPDSNMCQGVDRRKKKRIRNNMDEAEAGPRVQICSKCNNPGHSYKKCIEASYFSTATSLAPSASARGRRSRRYNEGMQWAYLFVLTCCNIWNTYACYHLVIFEPFYLARSCNIWTYACYCAVIIKLPFHSLVVFFLPSNLLSYPVMYCSLILNETCNELSYFLSFLGFQWLPRVLSWIWSCSPVKRTRLRCQRESTILCATCGDNCKLVVQRSRVLLRDEVLHVCELRAWPPVTP